MKAVKFEGANRVYKSPPNWDSKALGDCYDLHVCVTPWGKYSVWEIDDDDIKNIMASRRIRLCIYGGNHPPVAVEVIDPLAPEAEIID